jgi:hypothetical protein
VNLDRSGTRRGQERCRLDIAGRRLGQGDEMLLQTSLPCLVARHTEPQDTALYISVFTLHSSHRRGDETPVQDIMAHCAKLLLSGIVSKVVLIVQLSAD